MLTPSVVLLHANEHHIQLLALEHFNQDLSDHPPYSPGLALSDYYLFTYLKNWLGT
jgi:hypothetical protein